MERIKIKNLLSDPQSHLDKKILIKGWLRSVRKSKKVAFLVLNDGSGPGTIQIIFDDQNPHFELAGSLLTGASISVEGKFVQSLGKNQGFELQGEQLCVLGAVDEEYPIQKKETSLEFLREKAHLRVRTSTFASVFRVRHALSYATHKFFHERGFFHLHSPIITGSDCEGAGEMFRVVATGTEKGAPEFFGKPTFLTVSGQLSAECFAMGLGEVYTFGPTFRAENSHTQRHLAEFWMVEPEVAFADLDDIAQLAQDYLKSLIHEALTHCAEDLAFLHQNYAPELKGILEELVKKEFIKITYTEAINLLQAAQKKDATLKFDYKPLWENGLQTEHERYLTEVHFKAPVIVTDYPKHIKAFYMKLNDDDKTVRAMDILVPGIGEIIGGSQREDDLTKLKTRIKEMNLPEEEYWWYLELRKFGTAEHSGFGMGFERLVMFITGMTNIRDVIAFPRYPQNATF